MVRRPLLPKNGCAVAALLNNYLYSFLEKYYFSKERKKNSQQKNIQHLTCDKTCYIQFCL